MSTKDGILYIIRLYVYTAFDNMAEPSKTMLKHLLPRYWARINRQTLTKRPYQWITHTLTHPQREIQKSKHSVPHAEWRAIDATCTKIKAYREIHDTPKWPWHMFTILEKNASIIAYRNGRAYRTRRRARWLHSSGSLLLFYVKFWHCIDLNDRINKSTTELSSPFKWTTKAFRSRNVWIKTNCGTLTSKEEQY